MKVENSSQHSAYSIQEKLKNLTTDYLLLTTDYCSPPQPPLSKGGQGGGNKGFTLIEAIIVMVVVAILAAVIILRNPFDSIKLDSATRKVAADIRYAQKLAISNQTRAGMEFNGNYGYSVYRDMTGGPYLPATSPGDPCSTDTSNNFVVNFTDPRCSNYSGVTIATTLPLSIVKFNSLGTPYDGNNSLLVAGNNTIRLSLSGVPDETITIQAGTGRVSY